MSKALKWLEAESDRLEKECNENNDLHKTVNHSFLEGFNYALLNAQDLEQIQLDDNQQIVLQWLKLTASTGKPMQVVFWMMNNAAWGHLDELREINRQRAIRGPSSICTVGIRTGGLEMKAYTIKFYGNKTFVYILSGLRLDFRGYSKEDLLESLYGYGYLNEDELINLEKFTNAWTIEEEME